MPAPCPSRPSAASVPEPKPRSDRADANGREPRRRDDRDGRHNGPAPTPNRRASSNSRGSIPLRVQGAAAGPLPAAAAGVPWLVRHSRDRGKPAAALDKSKPAVGLDRGKPAVGLDRGRPKADIVAPRPVTALPAISLEPSGSSPTSAPRRTASVSF